MDDRCKMENLLVITKGMCDLLTHASIESSTRSTHSLFLTALNDSLNKQNEIYNVMMQNGWYQTTPVEAQKIEQVITKFSK